MCVCVYRYKSKSFSAIEKVELMNNMYQFHIYLTMVSGLVCVCVYSYKSKSFSAIEKVELMNNMYQFALTRPINCPNLMNICSDHRHHMQL